MKVRLSLLACLLFSILTEPLMAANPLLLLRRQQGTLTPVQMEKQLLQKFHTLLQNPSRVTSTKLHTQYDTWIHLVWQEHEAQWRGQFRNLIQEKDLSLLHQNIQNKENRLLHPAILYVAGYRTLYYRWLLLSKLAFHSLGTTHDYTEVAWKEASDVLAFHDLLTSTIDTQMRKKMNFLLLHIREKAKPALEARKATLRKKQRANFIQLNTVEVLGKSLAISQIEIFQHTVFEIIYTYLETHDEMQGHTLSSVRDPMLRIFQNCSDEGRPWMEGYQAPMEQAIADVIEEFVPSAK